jgi:hypothetical protein
MSEQLEMTLFLIDRLESAGIPYMLTGSVAMSTYIAPRMTMDVDLVVECDQTRPKARVFPPPGQDSCRAGRLCGVS